MHTNRLATSTGAGAAAERDNRGSGCRCSLDTDWRMYRYLEICSNAQMCPSGLHERKSPS